MLERDVEKLFKSKCGTRGWLCRKFVSPGQIGVPDRIVIAKDCVFFVELKRPGKKPRPTQSVEFKRYEKLGHKVYVVDSLESMQEFFEDAEYEVTRVSRVR